MGARTADLVVVQLRGDTVIYERDLRRAGSVFGSSMAGIERRAGEAGARASANFRSGISGIALAIGGLGIGVAAKQLADYADTWTKVGNRVAAAGVPLGQVAAKQETLFDLAQKTRAPLEATADLYQRLKIATSDLGTSDQDVLRLTETISKSFKASGASTAEFQATVIQLGQALGSGVLQGDELRSIREQAPALARQIAKEFDTTVGGLKKLGEQGKLTSGRIIKALLAYSAQADKTFGKTKATFADSLTALGNGVTRYAGKLNEATGTSKAFGAAIGEALGHLQDPAVIQAGVDVVTLLAQALQIAGGAMAFAARNFELLKTAGAAFIAIKLAFVLKDITLALNALRLAALANPFTAIAVLAVGLVGAIYELSDGFENFGAVIPKIEAGLVSFGENVGAKLDAVFGPDSVIGRANLRRMGDDLEAFLDRLPKLQDTNLGQLLGLAPSDPFEAYSKDLEANAAEWEATLQQFQAKAHELVQIPGVDPATVQSVKALLDEVENIRREQGQMAADDAFEKKIHAITDQFSTQNLTIALLIQGLKNLNGELENLRNKEINIRVNFQQQQIKVLNDAPLADYGPTAITSEEFILGPGVKAPVPGERPDAPPPIRHTSGGGSGKAKKEKDPNLSKYLTELKAEVAQLALNGVALKENEIRTQALAKAKEDFRNKLRKSADLTAEESAQIHIAAAQLEGVPAILQLAADKLPQFNLAQQLKTLEELKGLLTDPAIVAALQAQGLSAVDATKAINIQIAAAKDTANGTSAAIQGIGDALTSGIQSAQSFEDALVKVGIALAQMLLQAAAFGGGRGGGPLGKLFDSLTGLTGGLAGLIGGGGGAGPNVTGLVPSQSTLGARAGGGQALPGQIYQVGETGREWFAPSVPGQVIPNSVIKNAAGGGGGSGQPINFNISLAGANGDMTIARIAEAAVKRGLASVPEINRQHRIRFA